MQLRENSNMTAGEIWHSLGLPHLGDPTMAAKLDESKLLAIPGIGPALLARARAAIALLQWSAPPALDAQYNHPETAATAFRHAGLHRQAHEELWVLSLDSRNRIAGKPQALFVGGLDRITVDNAKILRSVLTHSSARGFIVAHNHPAGDCDPSASDLEFTRKLAQAAEYTGLLFLDHIILGAGRSYCSIKEYGWPT